MELNLSHNRLIELPDVPEWSVCLTVLDLSFNQLTRMPDNAVAPGIHSLNLSHNNFRDVPLCVCSFVTLHSLNLSDNPDILTLPAEMGRLSMLSRLYLDNLKDLNDPPKNLQKDPYNCIRYLNSKLRCAKGFYRIKLMLVGQVGTGKTTLVKRLKGKKCDSDPTIGVVISEWWFKPSLGKKPFHYSIWDFSGHQNYRTTHRCFLSPSSLYLLVFNLKDKERGVQEMESWLNDIALQARGCCVIIVGTHLDEVAKKERSEVDGLLHKVGALAESYRNKLQIVEVMAVGLKNRLENIGLLKDVIYSHSLDCKTPEGLSIMGRKVPASYHAIDKRLEELQQEAQQGLGEPTMHTEEFDTIVQQMNLFDIQDKEELSVVTTFLMDNGALLHYDVPRRSLHKFYFIDPQWLCDLMSRVVTTKERNPFVQNGILYSKDAPCLFNDEKFPSEHFEQYFAILDRFEIAFTLDRRRVLIPSLLPEDRPEHLCELQESALVYSRYICFDTATTPPGFWSRLLSRVMHSVPQVRFVVEMTAPSAPVDKSTDSKQRGQEDVKADPISVSSSSLSPKPEDNSSSTKVNSFEAESNGDTEASSSPPLPTETGNSKACDAIQLEYWRTGLYYNEPQSLLFRIESRQEKGEGVFLVASRNNEGKKIIGQLIDLVLSVVNDWYPGLNKSQRKSTTSLEQKVSCFECLKLEQPDPFKFSVEQCLSEIAKNKSTIECSYRKDVPSSNHVVSLADIVPELLLQDINHTFLLGAEDISFQEDDASLLYEGDHFKVYRGSCRNKSVTIKKYAMFNEASFEELRSEAKSCQMFNHPCLVGLVGVCMHPMIVVVDEPPLKSLEFSILKKKVPVHRLTTFRIAAQVAAALRFLHNNGIIFHDLNAANILLWTLDPASLCHCKLTDFTITPHLKPKSSVLGLTGAKGFVAPEVLYIGKRKQHPLYDHKADIFSFGMFLYQIITRRHPYYDIQPYKIDASIEAGERPKIEKTRVATTGYHYLTELMKKCWEHSPMLRPSTEKIIRTACLVSVQSIMCVVSVQSQFSLCTAIALTHANFTKVKKPTRLHNELWVFCNGAKGAEINMYNTDTSMKSGRSFIKDAQVQCVTLCNDHVWVGSRAGIEYSVINIFNIITCELVHTIKLSDIYVSCITASKDQVLVGTLEGYCFSFSSNVKSLCDNVEPRYKYVPDSEQQAISGIVCTSEFIWVSHMQVISFLNPDKLTLKGSVSTDAAFIGYLSVSSEENIVWSAHLGGVTLAAWDAHGHTHSFNINTCEVLVKISAHINMRDAVLTAMLPVLDTVWVGMGTGHIMIFRKEELLTWFQPYSECVRFLSLIPSSGPCEMEECMVVSGGKGFVPLMKDDVGPDDEKKGEEKPQLQDIAGELIVWEAFRARTLQQMKLVEEGSPGFLDTYHSLSTMMRNGDFKDGTHIANGKSESETIYEQDQDIQDTQQQQLSAFLTSQPPATETQLQDVNPTSAEAKSPTSSTSKREKVQHFVDNTAIERIRDTNIVTTEDLSHNREIFEVVLPDTSEVVCVSCPCPPQLEILLRELQVNVSLQWNENKVHAQYEQKPGKMVMIKTQRQLEEYLALPRKPKLLLTKSK